MADFPTPTLLAVPNVSEGRDAGGPVSSRGARPTATRPGGRAARRPGGAPKLARRRAAGEVAPACGPQPRAPGRGAVRGAARPPMIAFNVDLATNDVDLAKAI